MVRPNELSFARRGALSKLADRVRGARPGHLVGRLVGLDSDDDHRAIVAFGDAEVSVLSGPHKLVPGALVAVEVDSTNAPTRITGPVTTRPEGLDEDVPAPDAVVPMPELGPVEFTPEDQAILDQTVADLGEAQQKIADAAVVMDEWDEVRLPALQDELDANRDRIAEAEADLESAFPSGPFNVGSEIAGSATATLTAAALDAQGKANAAAAAAQTAAEQYAAGEISEAELRAAQDAQEKADSARDAAVLDANAHADSAASAAEQAAIGAAQTYADTQSSAAEQAAKTHAENEAARVKQEALTEAATDAQSKADAAASAAETAAKAHADLVAGDASAAAIQAAAQDAEQKADAARDAAIAAAETYADARKNEAIDAAALTAQAKADVAQQAAIDAASTDATTKADAAQAAAIAVANAAITTADGKNTITYSDVTTIPGPAPDNNPERAMFDMHRNRASQTFTSNGTTYQKGDVLAEWMWSGTDWVPVHMGDGMLRSLDVGKLTAGTGNLQTAVIQKLTAQLARLIEVDADKIVTGTIKGAVLDFNTIWAGVANLGRIITEQLIATGAVTAEALNVVHIDPVTGYGWRAEPEGLTFLDQEGNPAIVLRTDMANYVNIIKTIEGAGGPESVSVASISPEGDLTGRSVAANESLLYRGTELQESLDRKDSGIMAMARNTAPISIGSSEGRLLAVSFQAPSDNRMVTIQVMGRVGTSARRRASIRLRQSANGVVTPLNSTQKTWYIQTDWAESFDLSVTRSVSEWGWVAGDTVTVGAFVESLTAGEALSFSIPGDQEIIVKDAGPWLAIQGHAPWAPTSGGGDGGGDETAPTPRAYTRTWNSTGHRTYSTTSLTSTRATSSLVQGYWAGANSRGHWIFPDSSIRTELSGASNMTGTLKIRNQGTGTGSMTAVLKVHNYASAPSSFGTTQAWATVTVASGRDVEVAVPAWILNGFRDNTIKGVSLDHGTSTSKSFYGYFSPSASLKINYRK